jgi:glucose/arabinose dehydrogenase
VQSGLPRETPRGARPDRARAEKYQKRFAHAALDRGADLVFGHGTQTAQAVELYQEKPILVPEMSWKFEVAPGGIGLVKGRGLGAKYENDLIMGGARPLLEGGHLFRFDLSGNRRNIRVTDPRLRDRVADNLHKFEITESESLLFGRNFGTVVDVDTGPDGNLYLVSIDHGNVYQIRRRR